jgi:hypothetical protein
MTPKCSDVLFESEGLTNGLAQMLNAARESDACPTCAIEYMLTSIILHGRVLAEINRETMQKIVAVAMESAYTATPALIN